MSAPMAGPEHPLARLAQRCARGEALVAGVLSGTSADGIDVVLARCGASASPEALAFETRPFPGNLGPRVRAVLDGRAHTPGELARLSRDLGRAFGAAVRELAARSGLALDLVGSHGQTVYHHDGNEPSGAATLQLGDGDFVAAESGAPTVSDFRTADIAAGGEGAPLSALVDGELFGELARPATILNLGGIANATLLRAQGPPIAFDTGPANCLLDGLARRLLRASCDLDGVQALRGRCHEPLLAELLRHPFFDRVPPKSTGRDTFGEPWVSGVIGRARELGIGVQDLFATAVALVAQSVARSLTQFLPEHPGRLVLCGGGAKNPALAYQLTARTGLETASSRAFGVDPDAREALVFAALAARFVLARPSTEPSVTGARRGVVLGKFCLSPSSLEGGSRAVPRSHPPKAG